MNRKSVIFRKIIAVTACAAVICSAGAFCSTAGAGQYSMTVSAAETAALQTEDGFQYKLKNDGTIVISRYKGNAEHVVIPSDINGAAVTEIGSFAFLNNKTMKTLIIPEGIKALGNSVFRGCRNFEEITIPGSVTKLDSSNFEIKGSNKYTLKKIIGKANSAAQAFAQENNLEYVVISEPKKPAESVSIDKSIISIGLNESYDLNSTVLPKGSDSEITWASVDSNIVTVQDGKITGVGLGTAAVSATAENGKRAVCIVNVKKAPESVKLEKSELSLGLGESFSLSAIIPENCAAAVRTFDTDDNRIIKMAKTNWKASFTATRKGTALLTVTLYNGQKATCRITVMDRPQSVKMNKAAVSLGVGENFSLSSIIPSGSASAVRTFRTSNSSVVKMTRTNWTGGFCAVKKGTAYVTVRLYNGAEASCKVTVKDAPSGVKVSRKIIAMKPGRKTTLSSIIPADTAAAVRSWRSSNSKIIRMTNTNWTGSFEAVGEGTAWVTVRLYNGAEASCRIIVSKPHAKIYLSPSNQYANLYAYGNTNECDQCNRIADAAKIALERCNFDVKKAPRLQEMKDSIAESNAWGSDLHIPIHTNGGGGNGTLVMVYSKTDKAMKYAKPIYEEMQALSPGKIDYGIEERPLLAELRSTNMMAVYTEFDFHDDPAIAKWIIENPDKIGEALTKGICRAYGVTYIEP